MPTNSRQRLTSTTQSEQHRRNRTTEPPQTLPQSPHTSPRSQHHAHPPSSPAPSPRTAQRDQRRAGINGNGFDSCKAGNFQALQTHPQFSVHPPFREVKNWDAWKIIIIFTAVAPLIY